MGKNQWPKGVRQLGPGRWIIQISAGTKPDGTRDRRTHRMDGSEDDMLLAYARLRIEAAGGRPAPSKKTTLREYLLETWLPHEESKGQAHNTVRLYESHIRNHVLPDRIAKLPLADVTGLELDGWLRRLRTKGGGRIGSGLAESTLANILQVMATALHTAEGWDLIAKDPIKGINARPHPADRESYLLTGEVAERVIALCRQRRYGLAAILVLAGGLRPAEVCALRVSDVNFDTGEIRIERNAIPQTGMGLVIGPTKTAKSRAWMALPAWCVDMLRDHLRNLRQKPVLDIRGGDGFLFPSPKKGGEPLHPNTLRREFAAIRGSLGLDPSCRLYDLRGGRANLLREAGVDLKTTQEMMRHTNARTTMRYYMAANRPMQRKATDEALGGLG